LKTRLEHRRVQEAIRCARKIDVAHRFERQTHHRPHLLAFGGQLHLHGRHHRRLRAPPEASPPTGEGSTRESIQV
jgi:hypothetical protein